MRKITEWQKCHSVIFFSKDEARFLLLAEISNIANMPNAVDWLPFANRFISPLFFGYLVFSQNAGMTNGNCSGILPDPHIQFLFLPLLQ